MGYIWVYLLACGLNNAMRFASDVRRPRDGRWEVAQVLAGNSKRHVHVAETGK